MLLKSDDVPEGMGRMQRRVEVPSKKGEGLAPRIRAMRPIKECLPPCQHRPTTFFLSSHPLNAGVRGHSPTSVRPQNGSRYISRFSVVRLSLPVIFVGMKGVKTFTVAVADSRYLGDISKFP